MELFAVVRLAAMLPIKDRDNDEIEAVNAKVQSGRARRQTTPDNIIL